MDETDNIVSATRLLWILGQLVGLGYSSADAKINKKPPNTMMLVRKVICSLITLIVVVCLVSYMFSIPKMTGEHLIVEAVDIMFKLSVTVSTLATTIEQFRRQHDLTTVIRDINEVDIKLKRFPRWRSYRTIRNISTILALLTYSCAAAFAMSVMQTCNTFVVENHSRCSMYLVLITIFPNILTVNYLMFTVHMAVIWQKMCTINDNIKHISKEEISVSPSLFKEIERIKSITILQEIYLDILDISRRLNKIYDVFLIFLIMAQSISIFSSLYSFFFGFILLETFIKPKTLRDAQQVLVLSLISVIELLVICVICQFTVFQSRYARKLMYEVPISRFNKTLIKKINQFSLRMVHQHFSITAYGFFNIDCTLLLTVVGAVAVYLIMFIQFDLAFGNGIGIEIVQANHTKLSQC